MGGLGRREAFPAAKKCHKNVTSALVFDENLVS